MRGNFNTDGQDGVAELSLGQNQLEKINKEDEAQLRAFLIWTLPLMVNARVYGVRNIERNGTLHQEWFHRASGKDLLSVTLMSLQSNSRLDPIQIHRDNNLKPMSDTEAFAPRDFPVYSEFEGNLDRVVFNIHHYMRNKYNKVAGYDAYMYDHSSSEWDRIYGRIYNPFGTRLYLRIMMASSSHPYPKILDWLASFNFTRGKRFTANEKRLAR